MANNCVKALPPCELRTHQYEPLVREGFSLFFIQISPSGNEQLVYKNAGAGLGKVDLPNITLGAVTRPCVCASRGGNRVLKHGATHVII